MERHTINAISSPLSLTRSHPRTTQSSSLNLSDSLRFSPIFFFLPKSGCTRCSYEILKGDPKHSLGNNKQYIKNKKTVENESVNKNGS